MSRIDNSIALLKKMSVNKSFILLLIAMTIAMMAAYYPLFPGHDFHFHYLRLQALMENISYGNFPSYIDYTAINGYGYLTKAFYCDFVLIPFALIGLLSNEYIAYQSLIFTITILCGIFTFNASKLLFRNNFAAILAALLYTFCFYRLLDIYHRSAMGESITFTFVPLVCSGMYYIIKGDYKKWYVLAIGMSLMILTHTISSVLIIVVIFIFSCICYKYFIKEPKRLKYLALAIIATIFLSAYYTLPLIEQLKSGEFFYQTKNLTDSPWETGLKINKVIWGLFGGLVQPRQFFIPSTGILLSIPLMFRLLLNRKMGNVKTADMFVVVSLILLFASSAYFPWSIYPFKLLSFIQLPWRFYEFISLLLALAGGYYTALVITNYSRKVAMVAVISTIAICMFASDGDLYKNTRKWISLDQEAKDYNNYQMGGLEYIPSKVPNIDFVTKRGRIITENGIKIPIQFAEIDGHFTFDLRTEKPIKLELPLFYYKGYEAKLNGQKLALNESENGLIELSENQSGKVEIWYAGTMLQTLSWYITLLSILLLTTYIIFTNRKNMKKHA